MEPRRESSNGTPSATVRPDVAEWLARVEPRVGEVRARIDAAARRAGRSAEDVRLVAVTKTHPPEAVLAAIAAGVRDIGENHAVELARKAEAVASAATGGRPDEGSPADAGGAPPAPIWHFLGKLQSGTVRHVADVADLVQSAEPGSALARLARRRAAAGEPLPVLIEVDFTRGRQGVRPEDLLRFADELAGTGALLLRGLMTVPPATADAEGARPYFERLRMLSERLRPAHPEAKELSMGMTVDYEVGVEEGATMVRVGTALFGPRPHPA